MPDRHSSQSIQHRRLIPVPLPVDLPTDRAHSARWPASSVERHTSDRFLLEAKNPEQRDLCEIETYFSRQPGLVVAHYPARCAESVPSVELRVGEIQLSCRSDS